MGSVALGAVALAAGMAPTAGAQCGTLSPVFTDDRFGAFPVDTLQIVAVYDGLGTADLRLHLQHPATGQCCTIDVLGIGSATITTVEYTLNGYEPIGMFEISNVQPNGVIDGVAFGLYGRRANGERYVFRSSDLASGAVTPNFVGGWPVAWTQADWDAKLTLPNTNFDEFVARRQAQITLSGAQFLGDGVWEKPSPLQPGDLNGDGCVNGADLGLLLASWGLACCP
jgi:hypothetical protein